MGYMQAVGSSLSVSMNVRIPWFGRKGEGRSFTVVRDADAGAAAFRAPLLVPFNSKAVTGNSVVQICLQWSLDNIIEPSLRVYQTEKDMTKPVPSAGWDQFCAENDLPRMIQVVAQSLNLDGNAYIIKILKPSGALDAIIAAPFTYVKPVKSSDGSRIERYSIGNLNVPADQVIHFKRGIDPDDPLMGYAAIKATMRQVLTDSEIATYMHRIVQSPTPGILITTPAEGMTEELRVVMEKVADSKFGGENRGKPMILGGDVKIQTAGWSPKEVAIDELATLPEQRITAAFSIPAMVVGVGAGLDNLTYDNYSTAIFKATIDHLKPMWQTIERVLSRELLPLIDSNRGRKLQFDLSEVAALSIDETERYARVDSIWRSGMIDRKSALEMLGLSYQDSDAGVFYWQLSPASSALPSTRSRPRYPS